MMAPLAPHVPVLLAPILRAVAPVAGVWLDGTLGAGGYARALLEAGADRVIGIDRDPEALERAAAWAGDVRRPAELRAGRFGELDRIAAEAGARGARRGGPRHRRLVDAARPGGARLLVPEGRAARHADEPGGPTAADLVNGLPEAALADILFQYGEERAARRIARAIVADRRATPFATTLQLAGADRAAAAAAEARAAARGDAQLPGAADRGQRRARRAGPRPCGGRAGARARAAGWRSSPSIRSRTAIVKRFLQLRSGAAPRGSRHAPEAAAEAPRFALATRKAVAAGRGGARGQPARPLGQAADRPAARRAGGRRSTPRSARPAAAGAGGAGMRSCSCTCRRRCWWWSAPPGPIG